MHLVFRTASSTAKKVTDDARQRKRGVTIKTLNEYVNCTHTRTEQSNGLKAELDIV